MTELSFEISKNVCRFFIDDEMSRASANLGSEVEVLSEMDRDGSFFVRFRTDDELEKRLTFQKSLK